MSSAPSLALRSLLISVIGQSGLATPTRRISGATPPVRAMAVAAAARATTRRCRAARRAQRRRHRNRRQRHSLLPRRARGRCRCSGGAAGAAVPVAAGGSVSRLPASPQGRFGSRACAACAWPRPAPASIVSSAAGLLTRLPDPAALLLASYEITPRHRHRSAGAGRDRWWPAATSRPIPVDAHGEFARRGGILDVFPAGEDLPIRIEFIGDTVESIRRFDPGTQRSVETLDRFGLVPVRESDSRGMSGDRPLGRRRSTIFDYLAHRRDHSIMVAEPADVQAQIEACVGAAQTSYAEHRSGRRARRRRRRPN